MKNITQFYSTYGVSSVHMRKLFTYRDLMLIYVFVAFTYTDLMVDTTS